MESEEGVVVIRRAEIDTRAPFRSVKEAVVLFGERVLAGEVYAHKIKEMQDVASEHGHGPSKLGTVTTELEETKQSLQKAREEGLLMVNCLTSLKEELEQTKRELHELKERESEKQLMDLEKEHLKFIENTAEVEARTINEETEFQKKRYVELFMDPDGGDVLAKHLSFKKKKKKKPLIPLIGGIFSKNKGIQEAA